MSSCWIAIPFLASFFCAPAPVANEAASCMSQAFDKLDGPVSPIRYVSVGKTTDDPEAYGEVRKVLDGLIVAHNAGVAEGDELELHFPVFFDGGAQRTDALAFAALCTDSLGHECRNRSYRFWRRYDPVEDTQRIFADIVSNRPWFRQCQDVWVSGTLDPRKEP